ncbi:hypothetical protein SynSYN20_01456 [Synechococcus sp. SYN20]|nr:hypothetical protein SynSYN20_01456 [Synechococcus sp. SYN20]
MLGNVRGHHAHDRHVARSTDAIDGLATLRSQSCDTWLSVDDHLHSAR